MKRTSWWMGAFVGLMPVGAWFGVSPTVYAHALILAVTFGIFFGTLSLGRGKPQVAVPTPLPEMAPGADKGALGRRFSSAVACGRWAAPARSGYTSARSCPRARVGGYDRRQWPRATTDSNASTS